MVKMAWIMMVKIQIQSIVTVWIGLDHDGKSVVVSIMRVRMWMVSIMDRSDGVEYCL